MRRILFGCLLLASVLPVAADAQQWSGTGTLGISGGHQTNAYLDPVLNSWDLSSDPAFTALTPRVGLTRNARRTRLDVTGRARLFPRQQNVPQFTQGNVRLRYRISPNWTVEGTGGGTRYRYMSSRDAWWILPAVQWNPTETSTLTVRAGLTQRYIATSQGTDRQPSGLVAVSGGTWLSDRFHTNSRLFWSNGRTSTIDAQFGGAGASLEATYWPTHKWSIGAEVAVEQLQYDRADGSSVIDRIGRGGIETEWRVHPTTTVFAQTKALGARLGEDNKVDTDVHVSAGIRIGIQRALGGSPSAPLRRQVCVDVDEGTQVRIPYDGPGTPHLTGDFNDWSVPGVQMNRTKEDRWSTTVELPPGKYEYRIRVVTDESEWWLDLPSYAQTAKDAFGGTNGVCTVQ